MKKISKVLLMIILSVVTLTMFVGCGGPKVAANESAQIILDILLKADNSRIGDVKMTQEQFEESRKAIEGSVAQMPAGVQLGESSNAMQVLSEAILEGMTKIEYETTLVSEDKESATVELKIKGFDMDKVNAELTPLIQEYYTANPSITETELMEYILVKEAELIKQGYIKTTPDTLTFKFTVQDNVWLPEDSNFIVKIQQAIIPAQ